MFRIDPDKPNTPSYPSKTVVSQQFKECKELIDSRKRKGYKLYVKKSWHKSLI